MQSREIVLDQVSKSCKCRTVRFVDVIMVCCIALASSLAFRTKSFSVVRPVQDGKLVVCEPNCPVLRSVCGVVRIE